MRRLVLAVLLCACRHPASSSVASPSASAGALPAGPPLLTPGERMLYRVSLQGIELAAYTLTVGDVVELAGKRAIVVQAHAKLTGLGSLIRGHVDDKFTSWIDTATGRSLRFQVDEYASKSRDIEHTIVDLAARTTDLVPVTFHINDRPPTPEPQKASLAETWDYNAFLIAMRSWDGPPGTRTVMEVFRSRNLWNVAVTIRGKTKLDTELGELPAVRFDAHTFKLDRDGNKFKNTEERDFSLWISDDAERVPLQIKARTDYGDVKMRIVEYSAGTGVPLRAGS